jgi:ABC-type sulfate transport system substrate-binding protein
MRNGCYRVQRVLSGAIGCAWIATRVFVLLGACATVACGAAASPTRSLLNASYDPTRELYAPVQRALFPALATN